MIANVSPCASCCENTLNSLRYADRVKELKNENREKGDALMLARSGLNTTTKQLKKQHSVETSTVKIKGLPVALQRQESLPVDSKEYANKIVGMNRLQSAKPQTLQKLQGNKSPKYKPGNGAFGGGVQINSSTKNFNELNENVQSVQSIINQRQTQDAWNSHKKQPFAKADTNQQAPRRTEQTASKHNFDIQMDNDDFDQESVGLEQICQDHESLVNLILQEEEDLLSSHRKYIDDTVDCVKKQMKLIQDVDKPGSNVEAYISHLDGMLIGSINKINMLRKQMKTFERHLKEEEQLSQKFYEQQQDDDMQFQDDGDYRDAHDPMDDEFMDDMQDLHCTPSEPPLGDDLTKPVDF